MKILILDKERYRRYWIGKRPTTKKAFEWWVNQNGGAIHNPWGVYHNYLYLHKKRLEQAGIIKMLRRFG